MRKITLLTAAAISLAAMSVAAPAMAGKFQILPNIAIGSNDIDQSNNSQNQKHDNLSPFQIGVNAALFAGVNNGKPHGSQSIDQTQHGHVVFPFLFGSGQVNLAGNIEVFSWDGNTQSVTQKQTANAFFAFGGPLQEELGLNVTAFGSGNTQSVDQSQKLNSFGAVSIFGPVQQQTGVNVVLGGDGNTQKITQKQTESTGIAFSGDQQQVAVNAVVGGDDNTQTINQSQNSHGTNDTQVAANVVVDGNGNKQGVTQKQ